MNTGEMDRRVEIWQFTDTQDEFGSPTKAWTKLKTVWAKVIPGGGSETIENINTQYTGNMTVTIRYWNGLTEKMRVVYEGDNYDITSIAEIPRRLFWEIQCHKPDNK